MKNLEKILQYHEGRVWNVCELKGILTDAEYDFLECLFVNPQPFFLNGEQLVLAKIDELEFADPFDEWMAGKDFLGVHWNCNSVYSDGTAEMTLDGINWFFVRVKEPDFKMRLASAILQLNKHEKQLRYLGWGVERLENKLND